MLGSSEVECQLLFDAKLEPATLHPAHGWLRASNLLKDSLGIKASVPRLPRRV